MNLGFTRALLLLLVPGFLCPLPLVLRQFYSLIDLMSMCSDSRWLSSPYRHITDRKRTSVKQRMEACITLSCDSFYFGWQARRGYPSDPGRARQPRIGFDVTKTMGRELQSLAHDETRRMDQA
jgi:hypothetical protein